MRKVIWGSFLSLAYYACHCPDSVVGCSMQVIAEASIAMQPLSGLTSMAVRTNQANATAAPLDECIPDDPQPVARERKEEVILNSLTPDDVEPDAAPIVIHEDDPMPRQEAAPVAPAPMMGQAEFKDIEITVNKDNIGSLVFQGQEVPPKGCPTVMPYCRDDEEGPVTPPKMPRAEGSEEAEPSVFKAWIELFAEGSKDKAPEVEELPPPQEEEPQEAPKCEEDRHLHEHYPGCPRTTCPHTGKDRTEKYYEREDYKREWELYSTYRKQVWELESELKKKGSEESSEEPPQLGKKQHHDKEERPRTKGVDTMEYRKSDAGLDEYGPGQVH
jgi:hypothetical protein